MTDTENLREQFEAWARKNELEAERHKYADDQYDDHAATSAWWAWRDAFQAGHAAAKAETAAAMAQEALRREAGGEGMKPTTEPCGHGQLYSGPCVDCEIDWLHEQHRHAARTIARVRDRLRVLGAPMPGFTTGGRRADQA